MKLIEGKIPESNLKGERDLGYMLYDMEYGEEMITSTYFRAKMVDGVVNLKGAEIVR